ncbi:MAG: cytochrome c-type biogenesis protein CcmH [Agarilytica sp.]
MCSVCAVLILTSTRVYAIDAVEFEDASQRERFQQLAYELRCPKCQNQNLIDSDSPISQDLRREIARLILEGKSDEQIKREMVALYGDFILYKPPVQANTLVLWAGPVVMVLIGLSIFAVILINRSRAQALENGDERVSNTDDGNEEDYETDIDADINDLTVAHEDSGLKPIDSESQLDAVVQASDAQDSETLEVNSQNEPEEPQGKDS